MVYSGEYQLDRPILTPQCCDVREIVASESKYAQVQPIYLAGIVLRSTLIVVYSIYCRDSLKVAVLRVLAIK